RILVNRRLKGRYVAFFSKKIIAADFKKVFLWLMHTIQLKKGKDKAALQRHPWIFSGAIDGNGGSPADGDTVEVVNHNGDFVAYGFYNGRSRVAVRLLEWQADQLPDEQWIRKKIRRAVMAREHLIETPDTDTFRLIFGEADYLPGLIADRYSDFISLQVHAAGLDRMKSIVVDELCGLLNPKGIYERSDDNARMHEGLPPAKGLL